jgi:hypothetical protein
VASPVPACAKRPPNYVKGVEKPFTPYTGNNSNTPLPSNDVVTAIYKSPLHISIIPLHTRRRPRISHRAQAGRVKRRVCEVFRTSVASISPAVGRFHCAAGAQSFRFTRGAGRVFHNKCGRSDTRCYFIRRSRISHAAGVFHCAEGAKKASCCCQQDAVFCFLREYSFDAYGVVLEVGTGDAVYFYTG